ncbi:MAG: DUF5106 domain-containing protein [Clostridium sp.]|nr:DUF5106 domain-containing protein [Prevotella sp.]MCM1429252.1 DUF5106 domain-containing protein [Clostridium sp.]MCM1475715.1 DUF5106 domain-containing protein [Muribaculaceae bacterium]
MNKIFKISLVSVALLLGILPSSAQDSIQSDSIAGVLVIDPLFEYPTAPEDLPDLVSKTNYLMKNFWNPMDFKAKQPVSQVALNDAFATYTAFMSHADRDVVLKSVGELVSKIKKNPVLMIQFVKAAEDNLYGPRAKVWIDDVYLRFLEGVASTKKIDKARKIRYADQQRRILTSMHGTKLADFSYIDISGNKVTFKPTAPVNIIEFGDPDCDNCRLAKNYLSVNRQLNENIEAGKISVSFINIEESDLGMDILFSSYPKNWNLGGNPNLTEQLDIRDFPSFFVVDGQGKLLGKNLNFSQALSLALSVVDVK